MLGIINLLLYAGMVLGSISSRIPDFFSFHLFLTLSHSCIHTYKFSG